MYKVLIYELTLYETATVLFSSYEIHFAYTLDDIYSLTFENNYDLYIINHEAYNAIKELKLAGDTTSTIFIDNYYDLLHIKQAFAYGDDYLITPLNPQELKTRVEYHYKKLFTDLQKTIKYKDFFYHIDSNQLFLKNEKLKVSPNELKLVKLFLHYIKKPLAKALLYENLQSESDGALRVYISKLKKLGFDISYDRASVSYTLTNH